MQQSNEQAALFAAVALHKDYGASLTMEGRPVLNTASNFLQWLRLNEPGIPVDKPEPARFGADLLQVPTKAVPDDVA